MWPRWTEPPGSEQQASAWHWDSALLDSAVVKCTNLTAPRDVVSPKCRSGTWLLEPAQSSYPTVNELGEGWLLQKTWSHSGIYKPLSSNPHQLFFFSCTKITLSTDFKTSLWIHLPFSFRTAISLHSFEAESHYARLRLLFFSRQEGSCAHSQLTPRTCIQGACDTIEKDYITNYCLLTWKAGSEILLITY